MELLRARLGRQRTRMGCGTKMGGLDWPEGGSATRARSRTGNTRYGQPARTRAVPSQHGDANMVGASGHSSSTVSMESAEPTARTQTHTARVSATYASNNNHPHSMPTVRTSLLQTIACGNGRGHRGAVVHSMRNGGTKERTPTLLHMR